MVLGVSRNHAHSLFSRARDQLEASVAVLLVGRSGRQDCAALDQLLHGWDGRLTAALRKRVGRHIDRCAVCSDRRRQELKPALLLSLAPGALLGLGAARDAIGSLAGVGGLGGLGGLGQPVAPPTGLRADVLHLATDPGPHAAAYRAAVGAGHANVPYQWFSEATADLAPRARADGAPAAQRGRRDGRGGDRDRGGAGGRAARRPHRDGRRRAGRRLATARTAGVAATGPGAGTARGVPRPASRRPAAPGPPGRGTGQGRRRPERPRRPARAPARRPLGDRPGNTQPPARRPRPAKRRRPPRPRPIRRPRRRRASA